MFVFFISYYGNQIKEDEIRWSMGEKSNSFKILDNLMGRDHLGDLETDGKIEECVRIWT